MTRETTSVRHVQGTEINFTAEARAIQDAALAGICRVVKLDQIIFFSGSAGDAWMLDPEDRFAVCLARDHEIRPIPIQETAKKLLIEWNADYQIEGEAFTVAERTGTVRTILGYPTEVIQRMASEYRSTPPASTSELLAAEARLKTGRNDPCPCGSGRKYKRCCLAKDKESVRQAGAAASTRDYVRTETALPPAGSDAAVSAGEDPELAIVPATEPGDLDEADAGDEPVIAPAVSAKLDALWAAFDAHESPTPGQSEILLNGLLAQPPEATEWGEVMHALARSDHPDLPGVFRRIGAVVSRMRGTEPAFFYWSAAEEFVDHGLSHLLPEVAAGFQKLDPDSYDPEALGRILDYLLAEGFDADALRLAEHFQPILVASADLMDWVAPDQCQMIFELRVGQALCAAPPVDAATETIAAGLRAGIEDEVHLDAATMAAAIVSGQTPPPVWTRAQFDLVAGDLRIDENWQAYLRFSAALIRVAQEAWQTENATPGPAFHGLALLARAAGDPPESGRRKSKHRRVVNLLDYLGSADLEERIARASPGLMGVNVPRAQLLLRACGLLTRFAARHGLLSAAAASGVENELTRLRQQLGPGK